MSEPKRYTDLQVWEALHFAGSTNGWIRWEDYARLKAEVERLRKFNDEALAHIAKEERKSRERLDMAQAEVERLRKAGDAMLPFFIYPPYEKGSHKAVLNWNAAKEGKQS